jgi:hypothetical protein
VPTKKSWGLVGELGFPPTAKADALRAAAGLGAEVSAAS